MNSIVWILKTTAGVVLASPILTVLGILLIWCWDYPILLVYRLYQRALGLNRHAQDAGAVNLPLLVVIPSLLRQNDELTSLKSTVQSIADNGYAGELTIVVTIDGTCDSPPLYAGLCQWADEQTYPDGERVRLFVTGTPGRRSKPMAIEHGMQFVKGLVRAGELPRFPPVYVSTDADADLGPNALQRIVHRLQRRNRITGCPARVVAGALHVRGNSFWKGWRHFFTIAGQLNLQVAREYYVGNIWRYNIRWLPITGVPGAFYCTWSEIFLALPDFLGYSRTLKLRHWLSWWVGIAPPRYCESTAAPLPELIAGDTDDTVTAYLATLARYQKDGHFSFEAPRTPLHALFYMLVGLFIDRGLQFEPDAHVYTTSPTTIKSLFKQRKRWNSSRVELTGRFWPALGYHWVLGLPVMAVMVLIARNIILGLLAYGVIPVMVWHMHPVTGLLFGYVGNIVTFTVMTLFALFINNDFRYWRMSLGLPIAPAYQIIINWLPGTVGVLSDLLLFGNRTGFSPETTLIKGGSVRVALAFRLRRAVLLAVRSLLTGDVPAGSFWFGWRDSPYAPSGFEGWTTGKRRSTIPPPTRWFRRTRRDPTDSN